jgi:hypothetical protein
MGDYEAVSAAPVTTVTANTGRDGAAVPRLSILRRLSRSSYRPTLIATGFAVLLAWGFLLLPPQDTDLAAQLARADFAKHYPLSIIDFRWFGGTVGYGYTLWAATLMALLGTKVTGAIAAIIATFYASRLLQRLNPAHPLLGGMAAALAQVGNVVEGRITFACGISCGLAALSAITSKRLPRWLAMILAGLLSLLCGGASPVAAVLLCLAGAVALIQRRPGVAAVLIAPAAAATSVISIVFGDGGHQPFTFLDALKSVVALLIVLAVVPARCRAIRIGALLGMLLVLGAFMLPTPVGSNADRLCLLFALPVAAAFIGWSSRRLRAVALIAVLLVQLPVNTGTWTSTGKDSGYSAYYTPVAAEIHSRGQLTGRVEVPEMAGHWDSVYLARSVPLARGWLRQTDVRLNDAVFYKRKPTESTYLTFLTDNAVQYVAVPDAELTEYGRNESTLIDKGLPYLSKIWSNAHWTMYQVAGQPSLVSPPAQVLSQNPDAIVVKVPADTILRVRLRWYPWLGLESRDKNACIAQDGLYVSLSTSAGGSYTFNSKFPEGTGHCPKK